MLHSYTHCKASWEPRRKGHECCVLESAFDPAPVRWVFKQWWEDQFWGLELVAVGWKGMRLEVWGQVGAVGREGNGTPLQYPCLENPMDWRSLVGCSPWGHEELDTTERLHFHFSLLCTGEGNGNPLQCSCLENPRDGVAQSQTRLKRLSSSSRSSWRSHGNDRGHQA